MYSDYGLHTTSVSMVKVPSNNPNIPRKYMFSILCVSNKHFLWFVVFLVLFCLFVYSFSYKKKKGQERTNFEVIMNPLEMRTPTHLSWNPDPLKTLLISRTPFFINFLR